jgi:hypothetical protein
MIQTGKSCRGRIVASVASAAFMLVAIPCVRAYAQGYELQRSNDPASWQERGRQNEHLRDEHRVDGYYSAPPIIYAPPRYYEQPGASLNFSFPLFR